VSCDGRQPPGLDCDLLAAAVVVAVVGVEVGPWGCPLGGGLPPWEDLEVVGEAWEEGTQVSEGVSEGVGGRGVCWLAACATQ
jgi:hypothetical protein